MILSGLVLAAGAVASWLLTGGFRRYALDRSLLDLPNHRSLHTLPTPRGGGAAVVAVVLAGTLGGWAAGFVSSPLAAAVVVGGTAVAAVGWWDDRRHVPARWRAAVHAGAALFALACVGGLPSLRVGAVQVPLGVLGLPLAVLGAVWLTNLYNFMDGIDGIAGGEAVVVALAGGSLALASATTGVAFVSFLVAGAALGFLAWNWSPARIFMGDVGSGTFGFLFAVLALASEHEGGLPLLGWVMLLGVFVADATATLVRRFARRLKWYDAHRSHAYQRAVQAGFSHGRVATAVVVLNLVLAAGAWAAWRHPAAMPPVLLGAALLLAAAYVWVERRQPM
ncbi:MAG: glycosyltransferase family 4 protein [Gemmatimonadetes bacterium]|nr:glycosyltransferase family 4 protein [Gemmatimonadota bacterium]